MSTYFYLCCKQCKKYAPAASGQIGGFGIAWPDQLGKFLQYHAYSEYAPDGVNEDDPPHEFVLLHEAAWELHEDYTRFGDVDDD